MKFDLKISALIAALSLSLSAFAQTPAVTVHDPAAIAGAATNTVSTIEEIIEVLGNTSAISDAINDFLNKNEGWISRVVEGGQLLEMTYEYEELVRQCAIATQYLNEWGDVLSGCSSYNQALDMVSACLLDGNRLVQNYINFFKLVSTDVDKVKQAKEAIKDMKKDEAEMHETMEELYRQKVIAENLLVGSGWANFKPVVPNLDRNVPGQKLHPLEYDDGNYSSADLKPMDDKQGKGNNADLKHLQYDNNSSVAVLSSAPGFKGSQWIKLINIILGALLVGFIAIGIILYFRGAGVGDVTSETIFIRVFVAAVVDTILLVALNTLINF